MKLLVLSGLFVISLYYNAHLYVIAKNLAVEYNRTKSNLDYLVGQGEECYMREIECGTELMYLKTKQTVCDPLEEVKKVRDLAIQRTIDDQCDGYEPENYKECTEDVIRYEKEILNERR